MRPVGIEPTTSVLSGQRSTTELRAQFVCAHDGSKNEGTMLGFPLGLGWVSYDRFREISMTSNATGKFDKRKGEKPPRSLNGKQLADWRAQQDRQRRTAGQTQQGNTQGAQAR